MTDQFYKGNVQGANMLAEANNNKNAARLKKLNKSIQGSVNNLLKKAGKKPYDFDKEISEQKTALASTFRDGYASLSGDMKNKIFSFDKDKKLWTEKNLQRQEAEAPLARSNRPQQALDQIIGEKRE